MFASSGLVIDRNQANSGEVGIDRKMEVYMSTDVEANSTWTDFKLNKKASVRDGYVTRKWGELPL